MRYYKKLVGKKRGSTIVKKGSDEGVRYEKRGGRKYTLGMKRQEVKEKGRKKDSNE